MKFFKKYFASKPQKYDLRHDDVEESESNMPMDEHFVATFVQKGGHFFYPDDMDDFKQELLKLLAFLRVDKFVVLERSYLHFLKKLKIPVKYGLEKDAVLLGGCESLIASEAAIMTTAEQTGAYRNMELPIARVIVAMSNQILPNKQQALININNKYERPPNNIQTMSVFSQPKNELDAGKWFDVYLFLIENESDE